MPAPYELVMTAREEASPLPYPKRGRIYQKSPQVACSVQQHQQTRAKGRNPDVGIVAKLQNDEAMLKASALSVTNVQRDAYVLTQSGEIQRGGGGGGRCGERRGSGFTLE